MKRLRKLIEPQSRSREGAWIEISSPYKPPRVFLVAPVRERGLKWGVVSVHRETLHVAPVRERGLKLLCLAGGRQCLCRSREGAWIEIASYVRR